MPYPAEVVDPMRLELTKIGFKQIMTVQEAEEELAKHQGTTMVVVNSVCGCAAGNARPGVALALTHDVLPDSLVTVFAGQDLEATEKVRSYFHGYSPSSPSVALLKDGQVVFMLERHRIEGRVPQEIAQDLMGAFDKYCVSEQQQEA